MFKRGCGLEFLLVLCGLELSWSCPRHCVCYTSPTTVSCQAHNFLAVPEGIPPHSERIFLQNNRIHRLLRGHFSPHTVTLWMYSNNITYIEPSTFHGFTQLEELDLGDNRFLRALAADTFHGLSRLHALHLYRCGLSSLPSGIFQGLSNLQYLYLQDNRIEILQDDLFVDLVNLSHLFLHGNQLRSLHQNTFRGLGTLDRLLLHQNRLHWVHHWAFHDLKRLTTLYLFNNSLAELSGECLALLPSLEYLRLNDNPWECGCPARSLWDWLQRFRGSVSSVVCRAPPELSGRDLKQLHKEDFPHCSGSESLHQIKTSTWTTADKVSLKKEGRARNCTRHRPRGPKKGLNEVHVLEEMADKEYSAPEFPGDGKYDHTGGAPRRKSKCTPRTPVRPPSGVKQATNRAHSLLGGHLSRALSLLAPLTAIILR
nr:PREDICTED: reticulon-4 receptor-like 1 [Lepisosteus oculatus]